MAEVSFCKPPTATVLVVDDEPLIRMVIAEALDEAGYLALEAESPEVALELLRGCHGLDVLITDLHLAGSLEGRQVAAAACALFPALKVIIMSGDLVAAAPFADDPAMADGVLVKPFRLEDLWRMLEELLEGGARPAASHGAA